MELVGVIAGPVGLHGLCSAFRDLPFETVLMLKGEFARVDDELDESDGLPTFFDAKGSREEDLSGSDGLEVLGVVGD